MTHRRRIIMISLLLIFILLVSSAELCRIDGGGYDATATYGAEQFHIQLTEQAK